MRAPCLLFHQIGFEILEILGHRDALFLTFHKSSETVGNKTTSYTYDEEGNMTKTVDVDGQQTVYTYNGTKQLVRETSPDGTTYYVYYGENENGGTKGDLKLAATLKKSYTGAAPTAYDASLDCFETVSYTYDNGLVTRTVDTLNHETSEFQSGSFSITLEMSAMANSFNPSSL